MKYKVGDILIGRDMNTGHIEIGPVVKINWNKPGTSDGYYINKVESTPNFFFPYEVRLATKLERAMK